MKASPIYATVAAVLLMLGSVTATRADDGGKGGNGGGPGPSGGNGGPTGQVRLDTKLAGGAIGNKRPEGNADFRSQTGSSRLNVEVENVNLPDGTVLTVSVVQGAVSTVVGTITLNSAIAENELELNSQNGAAVPALVAGNMVTVANGATIILAGALQ
jgi:hypothetical protein